MLSSSNMPHILGKSTTQLIMLDVIIALVPAILVLFVFFGINSLLVVTTSVTTCVLFEFFCARYWLKTGNTTKDLSAIVTGLLLAFCLPQNLPLWMVIVGAFVAVVAAKMAFGGIGMNIFNPALAGRAFLFLSFPVEMTSWPASKDLSFIGGLNELWVVAMLIGFAYLLYKKVIGWQVPVIYVVTFFGCMFYGSGREVDYATFMHILSGGLLVGAIFMATDYVTSPMSLKGKVIFAVGCGVLTYVIDVESVMFAILIMNVFVPLIDKRTRPKIFGTGRR